MPDLEVVERIVPGLSRLVVGESLFGVVFAGVVGATRNDTPFRVVGEIFASVAMIAAPVVFIALIDHLYRYARRPATGRGA